jgi:hypothetical protein
MVPMMPLGYQVAGLLADQHRAELLREAARRRQLMATREFTIAAAVTTRSDLGVAAVPSEMDGIAAGVPSAGSSRS